MAKHNKYWHRTPFEIPQIVCAFAKVTADEFLNVFSKISFSPITAKQLKSLLDGDSKNTISTSNKHFPSFPSISSKKPSGLYFFKKKLKKVESFREATKAMFVFINLDLIQILVNVETQEMIVSVPATNIPYVWSVNNNVGIAIDRVQLIVELEKVSQQSEYIELGNIDMNYLKTIAGNVNTNLTNF